MYQIQLRIVGAHRDNTMAQNFPTVEECIAFVTARPGNYEYCILQKDNHKACGWSLHTDWTTKGD